ncbi:nucleoside deaminase [bacterium]|nr:nucleoside deaminase [bacterium]
MDTEIFNILMENTNKSLENNDVPVGAVIVKDGKVLAFGYNTREKDQNVLGHAEINAILEAQKILNNWNLSGCDLYVTLVPCSMCLEIIKQSRIDTIYYLLDKPVSKKEFYKTKMQKINDASYENKYADILSDFFKKLREKNK